MSAETRQQRGEQKTAQPFTALLPLHAPQPDGAIEQDGEVQSLHSQHFKLTTSNATAVGSWKEERRTQAGERD